MDPSLIVIQGQNALTLAKVTMKNVEGGVLEFNIFFFIVLK